MREDEQDLDPDRKRASDNFYRRVGNNLKMLRLKSKYTQRFLASVLGRKSYHAYGKMEKGEIKLSIEDAATLSELYEIPIDQILNPDGGSTRHSYKNEESVPVRKNTVQMVVKLDGTAMALAKQISLLENINRALAEG